MTNFINLNSIKINLQTLEQQNNEHLVELKNISWKYLE